MGGGALCGRRHSQQGEGREEEIRRRAALKVLRFLTGTTPPPPTRAKPATRHRKTPALRRRGFVLPKLKFRGLPTCGLQLSVFVEHRAAIARDAPAMGGERCATTRKVAPRHAGGAIAHSRGGRLARRKLGEIDGVGGGGGRPIKMQVATMVFMLGSIPHVVGKGVLTP